MSLKTQYENADIDNDNIVPLGSEQIKSVLKTQSEAVFQDKNISNNSNFIKKSLIDLALDFETKQAKNNITDEHESLSPDVVNTNETKPEETEAIDKTDQNENTESNNEPEAVVENKDKQNLLSDENIENNKDLTKDDVSHDISNIQTINENQSDEEQNKVDLGENDIQKNDLKVEDKKDEETQQALNSVRDAVSQSINKSDNESFQNSEIETPIHNDSSDDLKKEIEGFKSIFSSLSNLSEKAIYDVMETKILNIANELAGYQIDKMPDKYEKKIKSFLKNINCFEEKIIIEVNEKDLEAISKIESFKNINQKTQFLPNKDLSRGDIVLNCDGMHYSEKTLEKK
ncbi:FliH/SctL family protein [Alphaproteobacteria bacterium]|nr:FliH/SctL family protein [Alphaproteobacteria bacterium]